MNTSRISSCNCRQRSSGNASAIGIPVTSRPTLVAYSSFTHSTTNAGPRYVATAATASLPNGGTPISVPSPLGRLPIQQRSMPVARDISGGTGERDEASMVTLRSVRATPAVPGRTGDWESVGQVIARLRR